MPALGAGQLRGLGKENAEDIKDGPSETIVLTGEYTELYQIL